MRQTLGGTGTRRDGKAPSRSLDRGGWKLGRGRAGAARVSRGESLNQSQAKGLPEVPTAGRLESGDERFGSRLGPARRNPTSPASLVVSEPAGPAVWPRPGLGIRMSGPTPASRAALSFRALAGC